MNTLTVLKTEIVTQIMTFLAVTRLSRLLGCHPLTVSFFSGHLTYWKMGGNFDLLTSAFRTYCIFRFSVCLFETNTHKSDFCINCLAGYWLLGVGEILMWPEGGQREVTDREVGKDVSGTRRPVVGETPGKPTDQNGR